jgi:NAD(P)-dependent dehydrogenase (short-subunit alcohol dehydrogenase family)
VLGFTDTARLELRGTGATLSAVMPTLTNTSLVDGVASVPGFRNAEPEDIAARVSKALNRALRVDAIFVEAADNQTRRDYEDRARRS